MIIQNGYILMGQFIFVGSVSENREDIQKALDTSLESENAKYLQTKDLITMTDIKKYYEIICNELKEYGCLYGIKVNSTNLYLEITSISGKKIALFEISEYISLKTYEDKMCLNEMLLAYFKALITNIDKQISIHENTMRAETDKTLIELALIVLGVFAYIIIGGLFMK